MENVAQMNEGQEEIAPVAKQTQVLNVEFAYIAASVAAIQTYILLVVLLPLVA